MVNTITHTGYSVNGVITSVAGFSASFAASAPHAAGLVSTVGEVWTMGDQTYGELGNGVTSTAQTSSFAKITQDSAGNPFNNVVQLYGGMSFSASANPEWAFIAIKGNGEAWGWGGMEGGLSGNNLQGIRNRPVKIPIAGNPFIVKAVFGDILMLLDNAGNVYSGAGSTGVFQDFYMLAKGTTSPNYFAYEKVTGLNSPIRDIGGGQQWFYAITATGDSIFGCGMKPSMLGIGPGLRTSYNFAGMGTYVGSTPKFIWLDTALNLPAKPKNIYGSSAGTYTILKNGQFFYWGDNACGTAGNGKEIDYANYTTPWVWGFGLGDTNTFVGKPIEPMAGQSNFDTLFTCGSWTFYAILEDSTGELYSSGRGKFGIPNQTAYCDFETGGLGGGYPNSMDVVYWTPLDSMLLSVVRTVPPICISSPSTGNCTISNCSTTGNQKPVPHMTVTWSKNSIKWDVSATTDDHHVNSTVVSKVSGPSLSMGCQACPINTVKNAPVGNYVLKIVAKDNMSASDSITANINVGRIRVRLAKHF